MTTFSITPGAPYRISVSQPQVGGTPTPSISYAWSLAGVPIGSGRIINYTFDGDGLPATLRCVITLSNVAGSVSRTLEATIQAAANLPILNAITIRDNAAPTTIINSIANGTATLRVGGPTSADINPTGSNFTSLSYQWRRGGLAIDGATTPTYTLTASDDDSIVSVSITASNTDGSVSKTTSLTVGASTPNAKSHVGANSPSTAYFSPGFMFANLWYSQVKQSSNLTYGGTHLSGTWGEWGGVQTFNEMGWPIRTASNSLMNDAAGKKAAKGMFPWIMHEGWRKEVLWDALGLRGNYEGVIPEAWLDDRGRPRYTNPPRIGRNVTFDMSIYWRGTGTCAISLTQASAAGPPNVPADSEIQTVQFAGPDNLGPWGTNNDDADYNGPVTMKKLTRTYTVDSSTGASCRAGVATSDPNDPVRDIIILVSNVRDADTGEVLFAGYDETNYKPFQIHLPFYERTKFCKVLRSLNHGIVVNHFPQTRYREHLDYNATAVPVDIQAYNDPATDPVVLDWYPAGWTHTHPSGMSRGLGNLSKPGHSLFQSSPRALVEICNQLNADLWWCHCPAVVYPGTRSESGDTPAAGLSDRGELLLDEVHIEGLATLFDTYLKPGLKIINEYGNEVWNTAGGKNKSFWWGTMWAYGMSRKMVATVEHGGDGDDFPPNTGESRLLGASATFAGSTLPKIGLSWSIRVYQAAASALIAKRMRELLSATGRPIEAVAGAQSNAQHNIAKGLGVLFLAMPKLFKHLDAIAHAPYRNPNWNPVYMAKPSSPESDANLVAIVDADGDGVAENIGDAWQFVEDFQRLLEPYASSMGGALSDDSAWGYKIVTDSRGTGTYSTGWAFFTNFKSVAIDEPYPENTISSVKLKYTRTDTPTGWPSSKRRWNLKAYSYEAGNHYVPKSGTAKLFTFQVMLDDRYRIFQRRYLETFFAPFKKGLTRDPETASEAEIYRQGMVPLGIDPVNREPTHDLFMPLAVSAPPDYRNGMFWGQLYWLGHDGAPQYEVLKECGEQGWGEPDWWLTYEGID